MRMGSGSSSTCVRYRLYGVDASLSRKGVAGLVEVSLTVLDGALCCVIATLFLQ